MKKRNLTALLVLSGSLLLSACTITPAVPPNADAGTGTESGAETTAPAEDNTSGTTDTLTDTTGATTGATTDTVTDTVGGDAVDAVDTGGAVTETAAMTSADAAGGMTTTTTIITTTVTTVTEGAALTDTQAAGAAALPTPTPASDENAAAGAAVDATVPVSTPVAAAAATAVTTATAVITDANAGTILQVINSTPGLETLATALTASGMATALEQGGPLTFFAPTNDAFAAIPEDQINALLADPATLAPILQYHIVIDNVAANRLGTLGAALSSSGQPITVTVQADGSLLINNAQIVQADIPAANGAIHMIDQVLLPPSGGTTTP
jgi:uncharacterized surface protein with fasciclin (FAS1) repeats